MCSGSETDLKARARSGIYGFLAIVLSSHPTGDGARGLSQMAAVLGIPCPSNVPLSELDRDFMELFVVPNRRYVSPYESVYRDRGLVPGDATSGSGYDTTGRPIKGLAMGESTEEVQKCYLEAGVFPKKDLPDHIANELRFMAYLWAREAEAAADQAQAVAQLRAKFRQEHILTWIGPLRERIGESDELGYYRAAIDIAEVVLESDE